MGCHIVRLVYTMISVETGEGPRGPILGWMLRLECKRMFAITTGRVVYLTTSIMGCGSVYWNVYLSLDFTFTIHIRIGKCACPRVNDDQKIDVDDQKMNSGRPHDYWILESLFPVFLLL